MPVYMRIVFAFLKGYTMQANNECVRTDRFLRLPEVERICGLRKTTIYKLINDGLFPPGIRVGRSRLWRWSVIQEWVKSHHDGWSISHTDSVEHQGSEYQQGLSRAPREKSSLTRHGRD